MTKIELLLYYPQYAMVKFPRFLIFKGGKEKNQKINLELCKNKKMFIKCHPNSWCDKELFIY